MKHVKNEGKVINTKKIETKIKPKISSKQNLCFKKILIQKKSDNKSTKKTQPNESINQTQNDAIFTYNEKRFTLYGENNFEINDKSNPVQPNEIKLLIDKMCKNMFISDDKCKFTVNNGIFSDAVFEIFKKNNHAHIKVSNIKEIAKLQLLQNKNVLKTKLRSKEINFDDFEFL